MRDVGTLLEALPYIREFHGKTVVIKIGGAAMTDAGLTHDFAQDVVLLRYVGLRPIVVHGGGPMITRLMKRLGMDVEFVEGLRVSDEDTVEIAKIVLVGKHNKDIVLSLNHHGQPAVGLSGDDGGLFQVRKTLAAGEIDVGFVGADLQGQSYNINADEAAAAVAKAMGAYKLIFLTDVPGWLEDPADESTRISQATTEQA